MNKGMDSRENREALYKNGDSRQQQKKVAAWSLFFVFIKGVHEVEKVFAFLFGGRSGGCWCVVKEHWKYILHGLAFRVTIREDCRIDTFCQQAVGKAVTLSVAAFYAVDFPPCQLVKELMAADANLAHE